MGLLDSILGSALGDALGQRTVSTPPPAPTGGSLSPVLTALLPVVLKMLAGHRAAAPTGGGLAGGLGGLLGSMIGGSGSSSGLAGLMEQFQRAGYGAQANSWVGSGENAAIAPDAIQHVFGDQLGQIAQQAGITQAEASRGLAHLLPEVVDRLTPSGRVPDLDQLAAGVDILRQRLGA